MKKILIVDDNLAVRQGLEQLLKLPDIRLFSADHAKIALDILEHQSPDLILADVALPEIDGFSLCEMLKADIRLQSIPILLMAAQLNIDTKYKARRAKAAGVIQKPFSPSSFYHVVNMVLGQREEEMGLEQRFNPNLALLKLLLEDEQLKGVALCLINQQGEHIFLGKKQGIELINLQNFKELAQLSDQLARKLNANSRGIILDYGKEFFWLVGLGEHLLIAQGSPQVLRYFRAKLKIFLEP
ncbi:MAG: response regulator [Deinococcales bacterium]